MIAELLWTTVRRIGVVTGAVALLVAVPAHRGDAATTVNSVLQPGTVSIGSPMMGGAMCIYLGAGQGCADTPYLTVSATDVSRSPATKGAQTVVVFFTTDHWTGS